MNDIMKEQVYYIMGADHNEQHFQKVQEMIDTAYDAGVPYIEMAHRIQQVLTRKCFDGLDLEEDEH